MSQLRQCGLYRTMSLDRRVKHQEPARPCAKQLSPHSSGRHPRMIPLIDQVVADALRQSLLQRPVLMQDLAECIYIASMKLVSQHVGQFYHALQRVLFDNRAFHFFGLLPQDVRRTPRNGRVKNQDALLDRGDHVSTANQRRDRNAIVWMKLDQIKASERRRILILLAYRCATTLDLDE